MATGNIQADGDVLTDWAIPVIPATHFDVIDEDEGSPNTTDYIRATNALGDDNDVDTFNMETIAGVASVSQVVVWTYGKVVTGGTPEVDIDIGGSQGYQACSLGLAWGWVSDTFAIAPAASQADLDAMTVSYRADVGTKNWENLVSCMYCVVTYTPSGYGHGVSGVASGSIGKVAGVATASIGKVKGVA